MSLGNKIRHGAAWIFIGNTGNQVLGFAFGIILARLLVPDDFGLLVTIQVFTGLIGFVSGGGMGQALVRAKEATQHDYDIVFTLQLAIGCLIYAGFFFSAPMFAQWYKTPVYTDLLRVSALSFILRPFVNLPGSILYREMRFKEQTTVTVAVLLVSNFTSIAMAYSGYGVWSLIAGGLVGSCASALLLAQLTKWRPHFCSDIGRGKDIARYGLLVSTTDILVYLRQQASNFILSRTLGPSSVGLYNKGESLAKMPHRFVTNSVYQVLFRAMAAEQDNLDKCRYLFFRSITLVAVYATPFYVGILWLADPFIRGVYGIKWIDSATPLFILALAWPFWLMENLSGAVLAARNWLHREFFVQITTLALTCLAILIGLSKGINGVACAILGASVFSAFYMYWLAVKCLHARWSGYFIALAPAAILNVILAATLFLIDIALPAGLRSHDFAYMGILGVGGGLVYVLCFLYAPISALRSEQMRWRNKLGLKNFSLLGLKD